MRNHFSSRLRMLAALSNQELDHPPCSFMLYNGLKTTCRDYAEFIEKQIALGLDTYVQIPPRPPVVVNDYYNLHGLPVNYHPQVKVREWVEEIKGEKWPVLVKEYLTPAGTLRAEVYRTEDWRWGNHVPFLDDYIESRSRKFLITGTENLDCLRYLLVPPTREEINAFKAEASSYIGMAKQRGLLLAGGWGIGADLIGWIYGLQNMIYAAFDQPELLQTLLDLIADWNRSRMKLVLESGIDLYIKRAWYENCDFWSPKTYRQFLAPILKADVELAHEHGVKFGYLITSNAMPLLDIFSEAGVDVLIGVDPACWDLEMAKRKLVGKICLWGGVNGHLTIEQGEPEQVQAEVRRAMEVLGPVGLILSPVDNVREDTSKSRKNVKVLIDEWQRLTSQR